MQFRQFQIRCPAQPIISLSARKWISEGSGRNSMFLDGYQPVAYAFQAADLAMKLISEDIFFVDAARR
jgi:hypothetical protein